MLKRLFIVLLYVSYGVALVAVLLVVLFPRDRFAGWVAEKVERELPGFECRVEAVRYVHPFTIQMSQVGLINQSRQIDIPIDTLSIRFETRWPIEHFTISAEVYDGRVESQVAVDWQLKTFKLDPLTVKSVNLESIEFLQRSLDRKIKGILGLSGTLTVKGKNYSETQYSGAVEIDNFYTKLRRPVLGSSEFDFKHVDTHADANRQSIVLTKGEFTGALLQGSFAGQVNNQKPWQQSRLNIEGGVVPQPRLLKSDPKVARAAAQLYRKYQVDSIPYLVDGNIKYPQFRFGNRGEPALPIKK